ncbi:MBL fold metallo-hydrolase [Parasediminibacterium paludis]|uniref:MBL fold metallo-hydrolase n=1 Tax=Parasediminibacterium paludis TaxID=908966 RepID=A0ABV8PX30_9BACT
MASRMYRLILFLLLIWTDCKAQKPIINSDINYWNDTLSMQNAVAENTITYIIKVIQKHKPLITNNSNRAIAFALYDQLMNNPNAAQLTAVQQFYEVQMKSVLKRLDIKPPKSEIFIYKLYNHGFIVKSDKITLAFDFVRGSSVGVRNFAMSDSLTKAIIEKIDVFFVSHLHPDHADDWVAEEAIKQHKKVVAPDSVWIEKPFYNKVYHPKRSITNIYRLALSNNNALVFSALPGHQTNTKTKYSVTNNMYVVTVAGKTIAHTGDQYDTSDFNWIDSLNFSQKIDVLFPNCWSLELSRLITGFKPILVIPGHENELSHTIDHREPYFLNEVRAKQWFKNYMPLLMGELFVYRK